MAENWLKKYKTTPLDKLDPKIKNYLGSLPQELQNEIVITATSDGSHSKNSLHYVNKAVDLRFSDKLYNYISKDPNRHLAGLTLIDPNHGSAKHIHLSQAQGTKNEFYGEVDPQGRRAIYDQQGWDTSVLDKRSDKTNKTISPPQSQTIAFNPIDTRTTQPVQDYVPEQNVMLPTTTFQDFDTDNWNPFGYIDGNILKQPIRDYTEERKKQKQQVSSVVTNLEDSPVKSALETILGQMDEDTPYQTPQQSQSTNQGWLASYQNPKPASSNKPGQYNAGNLRGKDGKFRSFNTPEEGRQALVDQLVRYQTGTNKVGVSPDHTLYEAMSIYAPAADKNNPRNYTNFIANKIGVTPDTKIKNIDPNKWADAISIMEGNKSYLNATKKANGGELSKSKAKKMLHEGIVNGEPITEKQRKYFGYIASKKENGGEFHPFMEMAGVSDQKEFYKKYPTQEAFFNAYPQARNGYTFNDPNNPYQPIGGTLDYNGVQPTQLPQNAMGNNVITYQQNDMKTYEPVSYSSQSPNTNSGSMGAAQTSNWIGQAANVATNVIDGIGSFWKNIQVAAPQLLNALIPDNEPRRVNRPLIVDNQYAYGTGSQMMYENGGSMYEKGKDYTLTQEEVQRLKDMGYEIEIY